MRGSGAGLAGVSLARDLLCVWGVCFLKKIGRGTSVPGRVECFVDEWRGGLRLPGFQPTCAVSRLTGGHRFLIDGSRKPIAGPDRRKRFACHCGGPDGFRIRL